VKITGINNKLHQIYDNNLVLTLRLFAQAQDAEGSVRFLLDSGLIRAGMTAEPHYS
jgi:hypothetical protein